MTNLDGGDLDEDDEDENDDDLDQDEMEDEDDEDEDEDEDEEGEEETWQVCPAIVRGAFPLNSRLDLTSGNNLPRLARVS